MKILLMLTIVIILIVSCAAEDEELIGNQFEAWADGRLLPDSPYSEDEQAHQTVTVCIVVREGEGCPEEDQQ